MTSSFDDRDPLAGSSSADIDARFSAIVSGLSSQMTWDASGDSPSPADGNSGVATESKTAESVDPFPIDPGDPGDLGGDAARAERARRREFRRLERAAELEAFESEKARQAEEYAADTEHYVPPEPPPLPKLRRQTVAALVLLAVGITMVAWPAIPVEATFRIVLGALLIAGACGVFLALMRRHHADPQSGTGWDDGARL